MYSTWQPIPCYQSDQLMSSIQGQINIVCQLTPSAGATTPLLWCSCQQCAIQSQSEGNIKHQLRDISQNNWSVFVTEMKVKKDHKILKNCS
jgi:hypothetical protein